VPSARASSLIANKQKANKPPPNMNQRERNKQADLELLRQFVALIPKVLFVGFVVVLVVLEIISIFKSF